MGNRVPKRGPSPQEWPKGRSGRPAGLPAGRAAKGSGPRRRLGLEKLEARAMLASDLASAATDTGEVASGAADVPAMEVRLEITRLDGTPASTLQMGEPFLLTVSTRDLRPEPQGVFAVYVDVRWQADRAVVAGPTGFAAPFLNGPSGTPQPGALDELGAFAGLDPTRAGTYAVAQVPLQAVAPGTLDFTLDPADELPMHALLMYGRDDLIDPAEVRMVGARVVVEGGPQPSAEVPLASGSSSEAGVADDAATLLLAGTLETAGPLGAATDGDPAAGPPAGDAPAADPWPESDLLSGPDALPRRPSGAPALTTDNADSSPPAELPLASDESTSAESGSLLA